MSVLSNILYLHVVEKMQCAATISKQPEPTQEEALQANPTYPTIWGYEQIKHFNDLYTWLSAKDGFLGCKVCPILSMVKSGFRKTLDVKAQRGSAEWISCSVTYNGHNRLSQLASLRKKMAAHAKSQAHELAGKLQEEKSTEQMGLAIDKMTSRAVATTEACFNTAYKMAKCARPFADFEDDCTLQSGPG